MKGKRILYYFGLVFLMSLPGIILPWKNHNKLLVILIVLANLAFYALPLYFFRNRPRLSLLVLLPAILLWPVALVATFNFDAPLNQTTMQLILNADANEAWELLRGYFWYVLLLLGIYVLLLRWIYRLFDRPLVALSPGLMLGPSLFILILFLTVFVKPMGMNNSLDAVSKIFPIAELRTARHVFRLERELSSTAAQRNLFHYDALSTDSSSTDQVHVLVIGESSRADHWGVCGYERETSPRMSERKDLIVYPHVLACGYVTEVSVPLLLTGLRGQEFDQHFRRKSIFSLFSEAGYDSYCISNQVDYMHIGVHLKEAGQLFNLREVRDENSRLYPDMVLLDSLDMVLAKPGHRKFIVLWPRGNHYNYSDRYPANYDHFQPSNKTIPTRPTDWQHRDLMVNSYDNSIRYVDAFLDSLINRIGRAAKVSTVTYISDHGENLLDDDRRLSLHGGLVPSRYVGNVPLFIWCSPALALSKSVEITHLRMQARDTISASSVFHTLPSLAGIRFRTYDPTRDLTLIGNHREVPSILAGDGGVISVRDLK